MPNLFDDATPDFFNLGSKMRGFPIIIASVFKFDTIGHNQSIFSMGNTVTADRILGLGLDAGTGRMFAYTHAGGDFASARPVFAISANVWYIAVAKFLNGLNRTCWVATIGGSPTSSNNTQNVNPSLNETNIGCQNEGGVIFNKMSGVIDWILVWSSLSNTQITQLFKTFDRPNLMAPQNIVAEYRMLHAADGMSYSSGGNSMATNGSPAAATGSKNPGLWTPQWYAGVNVAETAGPPAPVNGIDRPPYGQVIFNAADEENRPRYGQRIARGTE